MITPWPIQVELAAQGLAILRAHHIVYFAMEERTGKTLTCILVAEQHHADKVLVITKKKALDGWKDILNKYKTNKPFKVVTYHSLHLAEGVDWDLVIIDEAHAFISGYPKPGITQKTVKKLCKQADIIYSSATPHAQGPQLLYHQFDVSKYSPWKKHSNFYNWFKLYGEPSNIYVKGIEIPQYSKCNDEIALGSVRHLFVTKTRAELGFKQEPKDIVHYVELDKVTREVYNYLLKHKVVELKAGMLVCESVAKLRAALHMLEGGVAKIDDEYFILANEEKVQYIKNNWGDSPDVVIMYQYIAEGHKLRNSFKHAVILQGDSNAEGVDLSSYRHLVVYSQSFSTSKHSQRRARQANKEREHEINVHFLLVHKAISDEVYKTVSVNKRNYVDSVFVGELL